MAASNWTSKAQKTELCIHNFINGCHKDITKGESIIDKRSARDGSFLYQFSSGSGDDVENAVTHAREAFDDGRWSALPVHRRKAILQDWANLIEQHQDELALYDCLDVGKPITNALNQDIPFAAGTLRDCAEGMDKLFSPSGSDGGILAYQLRKPIGVVGSIIGWNFPLWMAAIKAGPALAMGNSLVLKPSEFTPLSATRLAELALEAGVPSGVFNVVHGSGITVGSALAHHQDVDLLSFTGSSATGKQMLLAAGRSNMKRLMLECGGKSPYIVFEDCPTDMDALAADIVETAFHNQGEWCSAGSRLLIQDSIKAKLLPRIIERAAELRPGDPLDPNTTFGALINEPHLQKVLAYIDSGKQEGAELILGGQRVYVDIGDTDRQGYYLGPTIFDKVNPQQKIAQEEIFGPVLSIISFKDEAEAIQMANSTCYGLAAYAATENLGRAQRLAQQLKAGHVVIVGSSSFSEGGVELGGEPQRQSGFGQETGLAGLVSYAASTTVNFLT